jgi:hypothetical protein
MHGRSFNRAAIPPTYPSPLDLCAAKSVPPRSGSQSPTLRPRTRAPYSTLLACFNVVTTARGENIPTPPNAVALTSNRPKRPPQATSRTPIRIDLHVGLRRHKQRQQNRIACGSSNSCQSDTSPHSPQVLRVSASHLCASQCRSSHGRIDVVINRCIRAAIERRCAASHDDPHRRQ